MVCPVFLKQTLVYFIYKVLAWEIFNMKWGFAMQKIHNKVTKRVYVWFEFLWIRRYLKSESRGNLGSCFVPGKHGFFLWNDNFFFGSQILKRKHKTPIKVALACQRTVMNIGLLSVIRSFEPPEKIARKKCMKKFLQALQSGISVWPQWWSFADVSQQGIDFSKKNQ